MNIVITQDFFPKIGGAHLWLYEVYRRWPDTVTVFTSNYSNERDIKEKEIAFDQRQHGKIKILRTIPRIEKIDFLNPICLKRYFDILRNIKPIANGNRTSVIHCLRAFPEGFSGLLIKIKSFRRSRLVTYAHGEEILVAKSSRQLELITKWVYTNSDLVVSNSESTRRLVYDIYPKANVITIHPGVDSAAFKKSTVELEIQKKRWGWPKGTLLVSTVARMEPRKNHATVIEAIHRLRRDGLSVAYICGGDGQEKEKLVRLSEKLGISQLVHFPGALSEEEKVLTFCASHIFAMPSIQVDEMIEGFGIVFLEAAAAGIPSIAGVSGGQCEAVLNGKTGYAVNGRKVDEVANAIRKLAGDPALRKNMGQEGIRWAAEHDWERVAERIFSAVSENCLCRRRHP